MNKKFKQLLMWYLPILIVFAPTAEVSAAGKIIDTTYFFYLTEDAISVVRKESGIDEESDEKALEQSFKRYFENRGVVFSENSTFRLVGREIILNDTEKNAQLVGKICKELGIDEAIHDEWVNFKKIEMIPNDVNRSLRLVNIYWNERMLKSRSVKVIVLKTPKWEEGNVLYQGFIPVYEGRESIKDDSGGIDPFAQSGAPKAYVSSFEVDSQSLELVYIGATRPYNELRSLRQLMEQTPDDGDNPFNPPKKSKNQ